MDSAVGCALAFGVCRRGCWCWERFSGPRQCNPSRHVSSYSWVMHPTPSICVRTRRAAWSNISGVFSAVGVAMLELCCACCRAWQLDCCVTLRSSDPSCASSITGISSFPSLQKIEAKLLFRAQHQFLTGNVHVLKLIPEHKNLCNLLGFPMSNVCRQ